MFDAQSNNDTAILNVQADAEEFSYSRIKNELSDAEQYLEESNETATEDQTNEINRLRGVIKVVNLIADTQFSVISTHEKLLQIFPDDVEDTRRADLRFESTRIFEDALEKANDTFDKFVLESSGKSIQVEFFDQSLIKDKKNQFQAELGAFADFSKWFDEYNEGVDQFREAKSEFNDGNYSIAELRFERTEEHFEDFKGMVEESNFPSSMIEKAQDFGKLSKKMIQKCRDGAEDSARKADEEQ